MAKLKTSPRTARLITINGEDGTSYDIVPGGDGSVFVEVPAAVANSKFVKNLIDAGILIKGDSDESDLIDDHRAKLIQEATELGIKIDKRWKDDKLQQAIDEAKAPDNEE